jgi:hypothetical protein
MANRSIPEIVLEEAAKLLGELGDWLRLTPYCPSCLALPGWSHEAGCPLGRVARLRRLLGSGDHRRHDEELVALRRERGWPATPAGDGPSPAPSGSASVVPIPLPLHIEAGATPEDKVGAT